MAKGRLAALPLAVSLLVAACGGGKQQGGTLVDGFKAAPETLAREMSVTSGKPYRWLPFHDGYPMFIDRDYYYGTVPAAVAGYPALLTANEDKEIAANQLLVSFTAVRPVRVFIVHSAVVREGSAGATWLNEAQGWKAETWRLGTNMDAALLRAWSKSYAAGDRVDLGGPGCKIEDCDNYTAVVTPEPLP